MKDSKSIIEQCESIYEMGLELEKQRKSDIIRFFKDTLADVVNRDKQVLDKLVNEFVVNYPEIRNLRCSLESIVYDTELK